MDNVCPNFYFIISSGATPAVVFFLWSGQWATVRLARVYIEQVMSFEIYNDCIYFTNNKCWSNLKLYTITMFAKVKSNSTNCSRLYCYFNFQVTPAPNQFNFWHRKINWYSCVVNVINCKSVRRVRCHNNVRYCDVCFLCPNRDLT